MLELAKSNFTFNNIAEIQEIIAFDFSIETKLEIVKYGNQNEK